MNDRRSRNSKMREGEEEELPLADDVSIATLVVVPGSLVAQWHDEVAKAQAGFSDMARLLVCREHSGHKMPEADFAALHISSHIVITTPERLKADLSRLLRVHAEQQVPLLELRLPPTGSVTLRTVDRDGRPFTHPVRGTLRIDGARNPDFARVQLRKEQDEDDEEEVGIRDFSSLPLKPDHAQRPLWVCPDGAVFLEASSSLYAAAYDFLVAVAEPVARPEHVHQYKLTPHSLYAAVAVGITPHSICDVLDKLSKVKLPEEVRKYILQCTKNFGRAKLVLRDNRHHVESGDAAALRELLAHRPIRNCRDELPEDGEYRDHDLDR